MGASYNSEHAANVDKEICQVFWRNLLEVLVQQVSAPLRIKRKFSKESLSIIGPYKKVVYEIQRFGRVYVSTLGYKY